MVLLLQLLPDLLLMLLLTLLGRGATGTETSRIGTTTEPYSDPFPVLADDDMEHDETCTGVLAAVAAVAAVADIVAVIVVGAAAACE